jgi:hypothetical protein
MHSLSEHVYLKSTHKRFYITPLYYLLICSFSTLVIVKAVLFAQKNFLDIEIVWFTKNYLYDYSMLEKLLDLIPLALTYFLIITILSKFVGSFQKGGKQVNENGKKNRSEKNEEKIFSDAACIFLGSLMLTHTFFRILRYKHIIPEGTLTEWVLFSIYLILILIVICKVSKYVGYDLSRAFAINPETETVSIRKIGGEIKTRYFNPKGLTWALPIGFILYTSMNINKLILNVVFKERGQLSYIPKVVVAGKNLADTIELKLAKANSLNKLSFEGYIKNDNLKKIVISRNATMRVAFNELTNFLQVDLLPEIDSTMDEIEIQGNDFSKVKYAAYLDSINTSKFISSSYLRGIGTMNIRLEFYPKEKIELNYKQPILGKISL